MAKSIDEKKIALYERVMSRRRALSTGAKIGAAVVGTAVVAGGLGYLAGHSSAPGSTTTLTSTVLASSSTLASLSSTKLSSTSSSPSATSSSSSSSSSATSTSATTTYDFTSYPAWIGLWPIDFTPPNPVAGLSGTCRSTQFDTIILQSDASVPGTRAYLTQAALQNTYPNVKWSNFDSGANGSPTITALEAGQNNWDVTRGNVGPSGIALGYVEPITDYFNNWSDKGEYTAEQLSVGSYNGDYYLLPDCQDVHAGWWRKDLFAEAGYGSFNYTTFEYTGTTPNQLNYQELLQAEATITKNGSSRNVYATMWPSSLAALEHQYLDHFLRANGGARYWGDFYSCTITMDLTPYYNNNLDALNFLAQSEQYYTPGYSTLDLNALIALFVNGSLGYSFGPDPNLDAQLALQPANTSNPNAPSGVNVRDCIQPTTGWSDGKPLDPNLPPSNSVSSYDSILRGSQAGAAAWEWIRTYSGYPAWLLLLGNASGLPSRADVSAIAAADPRVDISQWIAAFTGWAWADPPSLSGFAGILGTAYTDTIDPFEAGTVTAEQCVTNWTQAATSALQKAGIGQYTGALPT